MYTFNQNEIAISGYSNSGKTTLITRLLTYFAPNYKVGYIKQNAHEFTMDKKGKDSARAWESGAHTICINDSTHWAIQSKDPFETVKKSGIFRSMDFVLIEGYKNSPVHKIMMIDSDKRILKDIQNNRFQNIVALIGAASDLPSASDRFLKFERNSIARIGEYILGFFKAKNNSSQRTRYTKENVLR